MLPIDFNTSIVILIFVALIVYILILRRLKPEIDTSQQITKRGQRRPNNKNLKKEKNLRKEKQGVSNSESGPSCLNYFGYLGTLPKNSSIPDECLGCTRIVKCLARTNDRETNEDEAL